MKYLIIIFVFAFVSSVFSLEIDYENMNKRNYNHIYLEHEHLSRSSYMIWNKPERVCFVTDTTINFKSVEEIEGLFGKPSWKKTVLYRAPSNHNILWILQGPLEGIDICPILFLEWIYEEENLQRVVLFYKESDVWISITNILYPLSLTY